MGTLFKHKEETATKSNDFAERFTAIKKKEVKASTKVVNVWYTYGCGCGGNYDKGHVTVPADSTLSNGDYIDPDDYNTLEGGWV